MTRALNIAATFTAAVVLSGLAIATWPVVAAYRANRR